MREPGGEYDEDQDCTEAVRAALLGDGLTGGAQSARALQWCAGPLRCWPVLLVHRSLVRLGARAWRRKREPGQDWRQATLVHWSLPGEPGPGPGWERLALLGPVEAVEVRARSAEAQARARLGDRTQALRLLREAGNTAQLARKWGLSENAVRQAVRDLGLRREDWRDVHTPGDVEARLPDRDTAEGLLREHRTVQRLALALRLPQTAVHRRLIDLDLPLRSRRERGTVVGLARERLEELARGCATAVELAALVGCTPATLYAHQQLHGALPFRAVRRDEAPAEEDPPVADGAGEATGAPPAAQEPEPVVVVPAPECCASPGAPAPVACAIEAALREELGRVTADGLLFVGIWALRQRIDRTRALEAAARIAREGTWTLIDRALYGPGHVVVKGRAALARSEEVLRRIEAELGPRPRSAPTTTTGAVA